MTAVTCPRCGLVNPPSAQRCDCGHSFTPAAAARSRENEQARDKAAVGAAAMILMFLGGLSLVLGVVGVVFNVEWLTSSYGVGPQVVYGLILVATGLCADKYRSLVALVVGTLLFSIAGLMNARAFLGTTYWWAPLVPLAIFGATLIQGVRAQWRLRRRTAGPAS